MPLIDANALIHFFEDVGNTSLSNCTRVQLAMEGIATPNNFNKV
jgi:hypothetical protein